MVRPRVGPAVLEAPQHRPRLGAPRCAFCGLNPHGTRRGVLRCVTRAFRLARSLEVEDWHRIGTDSVTYPYRCKH